MTIVDIEVLLHYYYSPEIYPESTPAVESSYRTLLSHDLLQRRTVVCQYGSEFEVTEKGRFWIETIRDTPLPVQVSAWTIPERES